MAWSESKLEDSSRLDQRDDRFNPIFPVSERNDRGDNIIGECKLMIQQAEKIPDNSLNDPHKLIRV